MTKPLNEMTVGELREQTCLNTQTGGEMSDTPRTDAARSEHYFQVWRGVTITNEKGIQEIVPADFARQLERELAECRNAALEEAAKVCDDKADGLGYDKQDYYKDCAEAIRKLKR